MTWNHQRWATLADPAHKSHLSKLTSSMFGCGRAFKFERDEAIDGPNDHPLTVSGKSALGTAAHETVNRALCNPDVVDRLLGGGQVKEATVAEVFRSEVELAADGRELAWYAKSDNPDKLAAQKISMVTGLLNDLHRHVAEVVLVEPGFIAQLGDYWIAGHVDLVYRPVSNPRGIAFCDWKSGATLPHPLELEHGFESGFYAHALSSGLFLPREALTLERDAGGWTATGPGGQATWRKHRVAAERAAMERALVAAAEAGDDAQQGQLRRFDAFPDELHYVHMQDYVPYEKAGGKKVDRPEHLAYYGLTEKGTVKYVAGQQRGPAWYPMQRRESDVPRLEHLLRQVVRMVRMGIFVESVDGNKCSRCPFKAPCLTDGYALDKRDAQELVRTVREIDFDGLGGEAA